MNARVDHLPSISDAPLPAIYVQARAALAQCWKVDECKGWADKMQALASYARQSKDEGLYKVALRIRARATRRCGELLTEIEAQQGGDRGNAATGGHSPDGKTRTQAATEAGLSEWQRKTALRVANVPQMEFERLVESDDPPTVTHLAEQGTEKKPTLLYDLEGIDPRDFEVATTALGIVREFCEFAERTDPAQVVRGLKPMERTKLCAGAGNALGWLNRLREELQCTHSGT